MTIAKDRAYHAAREAAERSAAGRAVSEMTRDLHLRLADLHADRAKSKPQNVKKANSSLWRRRGTPVRFGLSD